MNRKKRRVKYNDRHIEREMDQKKGMKKGNVMWKLRKGNLVKVKARGKEGKEEATWEWVGELTNKNKK